MKFVYVFLLALCSLDVEGQVTFQKVFKHPDFPGALCAEHTEDGGYIIAGGIGTFGATDIYLLKTDSLGNKLWEKRYDSQPYEVAHSLYKCKDEGYAITGGTSNNNSGDLLISKFDDTGKVEWSKAFGGSISSEYGNAIMQTSDGGFIAVGQTNGGTVTGNAVYIVKTDSAGNTEWAKTYNTAGDAGMYVLEKANGYIVGGYTSTFGPPYYTFIMSIDSLGDPLWIKYISSNSSILGRILQTSDGGYLLAGGLSTGTGMGIGLLKTDSLFSFQWAKQYATNVPNILLDFVNETSNGGYLIGGETLGEVLIKVDAAGNIIWSRIFGGKGVDDVRYARQLNDTGYIFIGNAFDSLTLPSRIWFVKADSSGNACTIKDTAITVTNVSLTASPLTFAISTLDTSYSINFTVSNPNTVDSLLCSNNSTGIEPTPETLNEVIVFPNPVESLVSFQAKEKIVSIELFNSTGIKVFMTKPKSNTVSIDVGKYPEGIYFYKVEIGKTSKVGKLLVQ